MKLIFLLLFIFFNFSCAQTFKKTLKTYKHDPPRHQSVIDAIERIPRKGPITAQQGADVQGNLTALQNNLQAMNKTTVLTKSFTTEESNALEAILEQIAPLGAQLLDDIAKRKQAWINAGILEYVCDQVKQACAAFQAVLDAFIARATPAAARRAKAIKAEFVKQCAATLAKLGCPK